MKTQIIQVQHHIFEGDFQQVGSALNNLMEQLSAEIMHMPQTSANKWLQVFQALIQGLQNKDYLYIADILEYELLPLLGR